MKMSCLCFLTLVAVTACDVAPPAPSGGGADERIPLGKADVANGSCLTDEADLCGGQSAGTCWCDEQCLAFGDCCTDAGEACGIGGAEPEPCTTQECGPSPQIATVCNGEVVVQHADVCERNALAVCEWLPPECEEPPSCTMQECGPAPQVATICNGEIVVQHADICERNALEECEWLLPTCATE